MPSLVSSLMRSGWRGVLMLTALVALLLGVVGLALGVGTSDDQATAVTGLSAAQTPATAVTAVAQPSATTVGAVAMSPAASSQTGATTSLPGATSATEPPAATPVVDVDVVVFSTQTSGLAAAHELLRSAPHLRVALISSGTMLETPLAQGLSVEDARDIGRVSGGFYREWRNTLIDSYKRRGIYPFVAGGRLVYEPEVATQTLWSLLKAQNRGNLLFYSAHLVAASDQGDQRYADIRVEGQGLLRINTRYFIDASVEADLARMLGAGYRVGRHEALYNDVAGIRPAYPSAANGYETAPQRFSPLLTLQVYKGVDAPRIAKLVHPNYNPASYATMGTFSQKNVDAFRNSWSMTIAALPNAKRELNEAWSDWPDVGLSFQWVFSPERRGEIRKRVLEWAVNRVRYLQEHGYPRVGIAAIPQKLYVREGPRILGIDTYTVEQLRAGGAREPVALGCYCEYDRHDAFAPNHIEQTRYTHVPMGALMAKDHPWLLVSTAVSVDFQTYSSAVRMEHTRAAMGGAAAVIIGAADRSGVDPQQVPYGEVRSSLLQEGYRLEVDY